MSITRAQLEAAEAALRADDPDEGNWPTGSQVEAIIAATVSVERDDETNEPARKIIETWTRGLITLAEMVTELQKVSDVRDRELLQAGAEIAARRNDSRS